MKRIIMILGLLGLLLVPSTAQISRLLAREVTTVKNTINEVSDSSFVIIDMGDYRAFATDIKMSGGVTVAAFCTLDETLAENSCAGWVPFSTEFFTINGTLATLTNSHLLSWCGGLFSPVKIMLRFVNSDDSNSCKVIVSKYN